MKKEIEGYAVEKRNELLWSIHSQGFNLRQLAFIFGMSKSQAHNIINEKPKGWVSPWVKRSDI